MFLRNFRAGNISIRQFSSALYITGEKAQKHFAVLTPIIDFDDQLKHKEDLIKNIKVRQLPINIDNVEERWNFFKDVENRKNILEQTKAEVGQNISNLLKIQNDAKVNKEVQKLKTHLKIVKEDLKNLRSMSYSVEQSAALQVLNLPNVLHPKTPQSEELEMYRYLEKTDIKSESHLNIGEKKGYLKLFNHMSCYLKSDMALFEYAIQNYFNEELLNLNYVQFSNSDFVKSIVVEGCGTDPSTNCDMLTLADIHCINSDGVNSLHLVGASSLYSFMAYFTKHFVQASQFPIRAFCLGRKYQEVEKDSPKSLFNLNQSSEIGLFHAYLEDSEMLENIVNEISMLYKQLGFHFRVVLIPANKLKKAESLRVSVQMFSNNLLSYVEVGSISFYQDYISKRLLFNYNVNKERRFPNVIGGSLINIHKVIGCVLENNSITGGPLLTEFLCKYVF